jgi:hypothetical protein
MSDEEETMIKRVSRMQVKFRVMYYNSVQNKYTIMFSSDDYSSCEAFCWDYTGPGELEIVKVWVQKPTAVIDD